MQDKRRYVRLDKALSLTFERKGPTGTLRGEGTTKNISPAGLCFVAKAVLGVGEKIAIALTLPHISRPLSFEGRVTWIRPFGTTSAATHEMGVALSPAVDNDQNRYLLFICDLLCDQLAERKQ